MQAITPYNILSRSRLRYSEKMANHIKRLREDRMAEGDQKLWTQEALAQRIGTTGRTLRAWEAEQMTPRRFHAIRLAKALGVSIDELGLRNSAEKLQE